MTITGTIDSLWRYPVKSMRGEELEEAFLGFSGVYGDRVYAFRSSAAPAGFPYFTAREQKQMLRYRPQFRHPDKAARPPNLAEAESIKPGASPLYADRAELAVDVETPTGEVLAIDDPALIGRLVKGIDGGHELKLLQSARSLTDCRPVSLFSIQTVQVLGREAGTVLDKRCFRANVYLDLASADGFVENGFVGRTMRIGPKVLVSILERDPRCKMITLDPETAESNPKILRPVAQGHEGMAGIYGAVLVEGTVRRGDTVEVLD